VPIIDRCWKCQNVAGIEATRCPVPSPPWCQSTNRILWPSVYRGLQFAWITGHFGTKTLRQQDTSELLPKFGNYCRLGRTVWPGVRTYIAVTEFSGTELAVCSLQRVHNWLFFQTLLLPLNVYRQSRAGYTKISQVHNNSRTTVCWGKSMVGWSVELNTGHHGLYWMCEK